MPSVYKLGESVICSLYSVLKVGLCNGEVWIYLGMCIVCDTVCVAEE